MAATTMAAKKAAPKKVNAKKVNVAKVEPVVEPVVEQAGEEAVLTPDDLRAIKESGEALDFVTELNEKVTLGFDVEDDRYYLLVDSTKEAHLYFTAPEAALWAMKYDTEDSPLSDADRESFRLTGEEIKAAQLDKQGVWEPNAEPVARKAKAKKTPDAPPELAAEPVEVPAPKKGAKAKGAKAVAAPVTPAKGKGKGGK